MKIIAIGADHRGFLYKEYIKEIMQKHDKSIQWLDVGSHSCDRSDYPPIAYQVARALQQGDAHLGILLCGTGIGMSIAINRFRGIYGALVWNSRMAQRAREDDHANVLIIAADEITRDTLQEVITVWLTSQPKPGRYKDRITMIDAWGGLEIKD